jgi:hypothetical protein
MSITRFQTSPENIGDLLRAALAAEPRNDDRKAGPGSQLRD